MSLTSYLRSIYATLTSGTETEEYGAADVERAINEHGALVDRDFTVTLGEPTIREYGGEFTSEPKIVVPATSGTYLEPSPLIFDMPLGEESDALFNIFMDAVGADTTADIEGVEVPAQVIAGNTVVMWRVLESDEPETDEPMTKPDDAPETSE